jgi:hypothetical protein
VELAPLRTTEVQRARGAGANELARAFDCGGEIQNQLGERSFAEYKSVER